MVGSQAFATFWRRHANEESGEEESTRIASGCTKRPRVVCVEGTAPTRTCRSRSTPTRRC
eukprot:6204659-Pleurochrysis_carterae.AAC.1